MRIAFEIGLTCRDFFELTPWQFRIAIKAHENRCKRDHDREAWMMWHNAVLSQPRKGTFPKLEQFMSESSLKKPVKGIDEYAIKARLMAYSKRLEGGNGSGSKTIG